MVLQLLVHARQRQLDVIGQVKVKLFRHGKAAGQIQRHTGQGGCQVQGGKTGGQRQAFAMAHPQAAQALARDTPAGCVLRSRFLLGRNSADPVRDVPDVLGLNLLRHCYSEFTYLSRFLPSLYYGEGANGDKAPLPW